MELLAAPEEQSSTTHRQVHTHVSFNLLRFDFLQFLLIIYFTKSLNDKLFELEQCTQVTNSGACTSQGLHVVWFSVISRYWFTARRVGSVVIPGSYYAK